MDGADSDLLQGGGKGDGAQIFQHVEGIVRDRGHALPEQDGGDLVRVLDPVPHPGINAAVVFALLVHGPQAGDGQQAGALVEAPDQGVAAAAHQGLLHAPADDGMALPLGHVGGVPAELVVHGGQEQELLAAVGKDVLAKDGGQHAGEADQFQGGAAGKGGIPQAHAARGEEDGVQVGARGEGIAANGGEGLGEDQVLQLPRSGEGVVAHAKHAVGDFIIGFAFSGGPADQLRPVRIEEDAVHSRIGRVSVSHRERIQRAAPDKGAAVDSVHRCGEGELRQRRVAQEGEVPDPGQAGPEAGVQQAFTAREGAVANGCDAVLYDHVLDPGRSFGPGGLVSACVVRHSAGAADGQGAGVGVKIEGNAVAAVPADGVQPQGDGITVPARLPVGGPDVGIGGGIVDGEVGIAVFEDVGVEGAGLAAQEDGRAQIGAVLEGVVAHVGQGGRELHPIQARAAPEGGAVQGLEGGGEDELRQGRAVVEGGAVDGLQALVEAQGLQARAAVEGAAADGGHGSGQVDLLQARAAVEGVIAHVGDVLAHGQGLDLGAVLRPGLVGAAAEGRHCDRGGLIGPDLHAAFQRVPGVVDVGAAAAGDGIVHGIPVDQLLAVPHGLPVGGPGGGVGVGIVDGGEGRAAGEEAAAAGHRGLVPQEGDGRQGRTAPDGVVVEGREGLREDDAR